MIWAPIVDSYTPKEWANYIFDSFYNRDEYTSPVKTWFDRESFFFWPRAWVSTKKNWLGYNVWQTNWNIVNSIKYGNRRWAYTDKWFIYSFDGTKVYPFIGKPTSIVQATGANQFPVNGTVVGFRQEYTTLSNETVMSSITVSLRSNALIPWGEISFALFDSSNTIITLADNVLSTEALTTSYIDYTFSFSWVTLAPLTKYSFRMLATGTSATNYIEVERSAVDVYAANDFYSVAPDGTETIQTYDAKFSVLATLPFTYYPTVRKWILPISYIWWGTFWVTATVSSYDSATRTVTIGSSILNSTYVAKFAYISAWAVANTRQVRQIETVWSATTFTVANWFSPNLVAWDTITFYVKKLSQLWFPQLREWPSSPQVDRIVALDRENFVNYFYFPNFKRLILWDNRIAALSQNEDGIVFSEQESLERFTLTSVTFGNDTAVNYAVFWSYLLIFFSSTLWFVRRVDITNTIDWSITTLYKFIPTAAAVWLYSENSFNYIISEFYIFWSNNIPYTVGISSTTLDDVKIELKELGREIRNYTDLFSWWEVGIFNFYNRVIISHKKDWKTNNFIYKEDTSIWYPHIYNFWWNFMEYLSEIGWGIFSCYNNSFVQMIWDTDLWNPIDQYIAMWWPKTLDYDYSTLTSLKLKIGRKKKKQINFKVRTTVGWPTEETRVYSSWNIWPIQVINTLNLDESAIWANEIWEEVVGTDPILDDPSLIDYFYVNIPWKVNLATFLIEMKNQDWAPLYFGWMSLVFSPISTNFISPLLSLFQDDSINF